MKEKVQVWIHSRAHDGKLHVLLLKLTAARGGFWQPVTGGVEPGEALVAAALREAQEETGLEFEGPPESLGHSFEFESRGSRFLEHGFALRARESLPAVRMDAREHEAFRWVTPEAAIPILGFPSSVEMLKILVARTQG